MVVRVVPWFISPNEFSGAGLKPGSLSLEEWQSLPDGVHPLLRHLVAGLPDQIQPEKQLVTGPCESPRGPPTSCLGRHPCMTLSLMAGQMVRTVRWSWSALTTRMAA